MKKLSLLLVFLLTSCATPKQLINNEAEFKKHPQPYHIFTIGNWQGEYIVLTLVDANKNYFIIKAIKNNSLKAGSVYIP